MRQNGLKMLIFTAPFFLFNQKTCSREINQLNEFDP